MKDFNENLAWNFLIASPTITDDVFEESVILMLEDNQKGSYGVIINKPIGKNLAEIAPQLGVGVLENVEVLDGGPLSKERLTLALYNEDIQDNNKASFTFGIDDTSVKKAVKKNRNAKIIALSGYTGWAPNQLKAEISEGTWILSDVEVNVMFDVDLKYLWRHLFLIENPQFESLDKPQSSPDLN